MDFSLQRELNSIIATDRADTTYKYALLRAISELDGSTYWNEVIDQVGTIVDNELLKRDFEPY
jgi:hypothetical protein